MTPGERSWGFGYLFFYIILLPNLLSYANILLSNPLSESQLNFLFFTINFTAIIIIGRSFFLQSFSSVWKSPFPCLRAAVIGLLFYFIANFLFTALILKIRLDFANVNDSTFSLLYKNERLLMSIGTVLLVPPVEEFLCRGLVFGQLQQKNVPLAYCISALLFAAMHVAGYIGQYDAQLLTLCFLQYIPAGLCLSWAYQKADNIFAPILMHITINQIGIQAMR